MNSIAHNNALINLIFIAAFPLFSDGSQFLFVFVGYIEGKICHTTHLSQAFPHPNAAQDTQKRAAAFGGK